MRSRIASRNLNTRECRAPRGPETSRWKKNFKVVGFRIGNETYGVRIAAVREIVRVPEITAVPSAPDLIEGVINLRGKIIPVMDLRKRFGQVEIQPDKKNRILVVELDNKLIGLIVNAASKCSKSRPPTSKPRAVFRRRRIGYVTGVGKLKGVSSFCWTFLNSCIARNTNDSRRLRNPSLPQGNVRPACA